MSKGAKLFPGILFAAILLPLSVSSVSAESQDPHTELIRIDDILSLEKTTLVLSVPENNKVPWAFVEGKISDPAPEYPVIIQIYDNDHPEANSNDSGAVHFAQTAVNPDGTYEYKFRVANLVDGKFVNVFEGDYTVKIFKVVYSDSNLSAL